MAVTILLIPPLQLPAEWIRIIPNMRRRSVIFSVKQKVDLEAIPTEQAVIWAGYLPATAVRDLSAQTDAVSVWAATF